jgi:hypothetical protein
MSFSEHIGRRTRKLSRVTGAPIVTLGLEAHPAGGAYALYAIAGARLGEIELMILSLLRGLENDLLENAGQGCEDCAQRLERISAAAAAIQPAFPDARKPLGMGSC